MVLGHCWHCLDLQQLEPSQDEPGDSVHCPRAQVCPQQGLAGFRDLAGLSVSLLHNSGRRCEGLVWGTLSLDSGVGLLLRGTTPFPEGHPVSFTVTWGEAARPQLSLGLQPLPAGD